MWHQLVKPNVTSERIVVCTKHLAASVVKWFLLNIKLVLSFYFFQFYYIHCFSSLTRAITPICAPAAPELSLPVPKPQGWFLHVSFFHSLHWRHRCRHKKNQAADLKWPVCVYWMFNIYMNKQKCIKIKQPHYFHPLFHRSSSPPPSSPSVIIFVHKQDKTTPEGQAASHLRVVLIWYDGEDTLWFMTRLLWYWSVWQCPELCL